MHDVLLLLAPADLIAAVSRQLFDRHIAMVVVGFPATPLFLGRARICISAAHTREDMDFALTIMEEVSKANSMQFRKQTFKDQLAELTRVTSVRTAN